jgi:hypothetical protein
VVSENEQVYSGARINVRDITPYLNYGLGSANSAHHTFVAALPT